MLELQIYKCHKLVHGAEIIGIDQNEDGSAVLAFEEEQTLTVDADVASRMKCTEEDLGFYVVYEDGYASWSPTKAWEDGYHETEGPNLNLDDEGTAISDVTEGDGGGSENPEPQVGDKVSVNHYDEQTGGVVADSPFVEFVIVESDKVTDTGNGFVITREEKKYLLCGIIKED